MEIVIAEGLSEERLPDGSGLSLRQWCGEEPVEINGQKMWVGATRYDCGHYHPAGCGQPHKKIVVLLNEEERALGEEIVPQMRAAAKKAAKYKEEEGFGFEPNYFPKKK